MCSKEIEIRDSNEELVPAILEALHIYCCFFQEQLILESDSQTAISLVNSLASGPWKFQFYFNEIKSLSSSSQVFFSHVNRSTNGMGGMLSKQV